MFNNCLRTKVRTPSYNNVLAVVATTMCSLLYLQQCVFAIEKKAKEYSCGFNLFILQHRKTFSEINLCIIATPI
jgi:hypothetical protein